MSKTSERTPNTVLRVFLKGSADINMKTSFMMSLLKNADDKINHFDSLRQRNLVIALAVFAGMSGFTFRAPNDFSAMFTSASLTILMIIFTVLDHRLDKYNCGWQGTRKKLIATLQEVINTPDEDIEFLRYDVDSEKLAKLTGLKSIVHILMVIGGFLTFGAYYLSKGSN